MKSLLRRLVLWLYRRHSPYKPLISISVSRSRLLHNLSEFRRLAPSGLVAPVLKSNAYGHGLIEAAEILHGNGGGSARSRGIPFTVVDSYFEALALRSRGCKHPLLVIGYTRPSDIRRCRLHGVSFTVTSMETLKALCSSETDARIHLKLDTGMRRQGLLPDEIHAAIAEIKDCSGVELEGVCTHFCDSDNADASFTEGQIAIWNRAVKQIRASFPSLKYAHASATDGSAFAKDIDADVMRLGIGLYGLSENPYLNGELDLRPALEMKTILTGVKALRTGETVGYGNTYTAGRDMTIATIPVGYFEGLDRRLSSGPDGEPNGFVQVGPDKVLCPIIGRVSMNISAIDVSRVHGAAIGMEAVVVSMESSDLNSIHNIARAIGTISYEVAVKIPGHLRRTVVE